jgi:hypothetical protein
MNQRCHDPADQRSIEELVRRRVGGVDEEVKQAEAVKYGIDVEHVAGERLKYGLVLREELLHFREGRSAL